MQGQLADLRVVQEGGRAFPAADVVSGPELAEPFAGQGELADELREPRVVGVAADHGPQLRHDVRGALIPIGVQLRGFTQAAARERAAEIGEQLVGSVTGSSGQLCTKPGLVLVPAGADGDAVVKAAAAALERAQVIPLLNSRIQQSYVDGTAELAATRGVSTVATGAPSGEGLTVSPLLVTVDAAEIPDAAFAEYFGPAAVIARYSTPAELAAVLDRLPASLTATVHTGADEQNVAVLAALGRRAGRLVFDGYPTGVAVSWAQHHGGPWPATNSLHTSVGATAIRRFLRPLTWQNAPAGTLPDELTDKPAAPLPRRIDGQLRLPQ